MEINNRPVHVERYFEDASTPGHATHYLAYVEVDDAGQANQVVQDLNNSSLWPTGSDWSAISQLGSTSPTTTPDTIVPMDLDPSAAAIGIVYFWALVMMPYRVYFVPGLSRPIIIPY